MKTELVYIAKDGMRFDDPYKCEQYEKRLGKVNGSVGKAKVDLKEIGEDAFLQGVMCVKHDGVNNWSTYATMEVTDYLEDCVNLHEKPQYVTATVKDALARLEKFDDSDDCFYIFLYSEKKVFTQNPFGATFQANPSVWEKDEEEKKG